MMDSWFLEQNERYAIRANVMSKTRDSKLREYERMSKKRD